MRRTHTNRVLTSLAASLLAVGAHAATFTVTNVDDDGAGSLRDAMTQANATAGADRIVFDISGAGPHVISPASSLPAITEAVAIDATSQTGIVLDGGLTPSPDRTPPTLNRDGFPGILIQSGGSTIAGLEIRGFLRGIAMGNRNRESGVTASGNTIRDNHIHSNEIQGVDIYAEGPGVSASSNMLDNNDLHDNFAAGQLQAVNGATVSDNTVQGNQIHDNVASGLSVLALSVQSGERNTVSGNVIRDNGILRNGSAEGDGGLTLGALAIGANDGNTTTMEDNTVEGNRIHGNAPHGLHLFAGTNDGGRSLTTNNRIARNSIETNRDWGVETEGTPRGFPPIFESGMVVGNVFQDNTFAGNGQGGLRGGNATAVQSTTWGLIKSR